MKYFRILSLIYLVILFSSCSSIKEGFINQKKNSSDEFLVEKKSPLVMPPDYNELLIPKQSEVESNLEPNKIKKLVVSDENNSSSEVSEEGKGSFNEEFLKKIKKN
tara:strand:+ start:1547 stop:1864 length:318 start_codon:yes stop_codon:yes gene_type:complete